MPTLIVPEEVPPEVLLVTAAFTKYIVALAPVFVPVDAPVALLVAPDVTPLDTLAEALPPVALAEPPVAVMLYV